MAIYKRDIVDINLETGNIHRSFLKHSIGYLDQAADHFGIRVLRNGEPVDLTGVTVQGIFMPPQGNPIAITSGNIVDFNEAEVVLPQACYNYDGQFCLSIKLVDATNAITGTMRIVDGMVDNTHASGTVAPTGAVPTYQEILSVYDDLVDALADVADYAENFAPAFAAGTANAAGSYVMYEGDLYLLPNGHEANVTWANTTKTKVNVGGQLSDVKSALGEKIQIVKGYFTSGAWSSSNYSAFLKVIPGSTFTFAREAASQSSSFYGLKSVTLPPTVGDVPVFSEEEGWTEGISISNHSSVSGVIPADVNWIYFYAGTNTNYTRLPTSIVVNGINILNSTVVDDVNTLAFNAKNVNSELSNIMQYAFYGNKVSFDSLTDPDNWVVGSRITDVGANRADTSACRTNYIGLKTITRIRLNHSDYIFNVWGYSASSVESMVAMLKPQYSSDDVLIAPNNGITRYRIAVKKKDGSTFTGDYSDTSSDIYKVLNALETYVDVDDTLTATGVAADAKVTGDQLSNLNDNNARMLRYDSTNTASTTTNGVTYSVTDGLASFSGESTASIRINRSGSSESIPSWLEENTDYFVELNETGTKNVNVVINTYKDHEVVKTLFASSTYGSFNTGSFVGIDGLVIRYAIAKGEEVDCTLRLKIYNAPGNKYMMDSQNAPKKIRVMQYNIGKFNMGQDIDDEPSESGYYRFITTDNFDTCLANYRRVLGDIQPDIIGFQEYEKEVSVYVPNQAAPTKPTVVDHVEDMDEDLFDRLYPYGRDDVNTGVKSKKAIKSKYMLTKTKRKAISYSYTYDGVEYSDTAHVIYAMIDIEGKNVACISNAFPNKPNTYDDTRDMLMKKAVYQAVVDSLADEEYVIIICDSNANPEKMTTIMNDVLIPAGYNSAMGSYFPWQTTIETIHGNLASIDNIFYKEGKIKLCNFKVLWDERPNLCSDHVPVYADLMLM